MSPSIRDHVDLDSAAAIVTDDPDAPGAGVLGMMVFYNVADVIRVTREELIELFERYRIAEGYLPRQIEPATILKTLVSKRSSVANIDSRDWTVTYSAEEKADGSIYIRVSRERARSRAERTALAAGGDYRGIPEWEKITVAVMGWTPEVADALDWEVLGEHVNEYPYESLLTGLVEEWDERRQFYGRSQVNTLITKILNDTMSVKTRPSGGVWLVPQNATELLERVERMIHELDEYYRRTLAAGEEADLTEEQRHCEFDSIMLVDRDKNRLYVRTKVEAEILPRLDEATVKLLTAVASSEPPGMATLNEATRLRREALAYRDNFAAVFGDYEILDAKLADFERAYRAAARIAAGGAAK